ncbi:hypothetical protein [Streptomyces sp. NPDC046862]|uniref:hypothetical protein n=1 Tax=Streptomyces sp. NPDC046862 TaxID=3154603 RepID=UPI0034572164
MTTLVGTFDAGTVAAWRIGIQGLRAGEPVLRMIPTWYIGTDLDPAWEFPFKGQGWRVVVDGDVPLDTTIRFTWPTEEERSLVGYGNASRPVNAVPYVCAVRARHRHILRTAPDYCPLGLTSQQRPVTDKEYGPMKVANPEVTLDEEAHGFPTEARNTAVIGWNLVAAAHGDDGKQYWFNTGLMSLAEGWGNLDFWQMCVRSTPGQVVQPSGSVHRVAGSHPASQPSGTSRPVARSP